jgi:hypothetical protein
MEIHDEIDEHCEQEARIERPPFKKKIDRRWLKFIVKIV